MLQSINTSANLAAFIVSAMLLIAAILGGNLRAKVFRWFFALVLITFAGSPGDYLIMLLWGTPGATVRTIIQIIDFINYGTMGITLIAAGLYFYEFFSTRRHVPRAFAYFHFALAFLVTVYFIVAQFTPILVWLDAANNYHKGSLFWLYELFPMLSLAACTALTLTSIRYLRRREWISLLLYTVIPLVCYMIETIVPGIWLTYLSSAITLFLVYINIQLELRHTLLEKDAELAEGRIAMMVSQIQPHFLFNTLSSISQICADNPLAQTSLITFSEYLRVNMDSLSQKTPIPFGRELAHVQQYLWLEQLRFEEKLTVVYDIQTEDFMLPVLTLQPVVENAVRHGITRKASGGTVWIRTEPAAKGARIVVRDDGAGFDPMAPRTDGRSHTGLDNVRQRLAAMCGGSLTLQSALGQGTIVTIDIPGEGRNLQ